MEWLLIVARIIIGAPFIASGAFHFIMGAQLRAFARMKGVPSPGATVPVAGAWMILVAGSVILGIYPTIGVWLLIAWLVTVSFFMHPFWREEGEMAQNDMQQVLKHTGWAGGLFALAVVGERGPVLVGF